MGKCPPDKKSIERINNKRGYSKKNCKWANVLEQNRNRGGIKLKISDIPQIKKLYKSGLVQREIALKYQVRRQQISKIILGQRWGK